MAQTFSEWRRGNSGTHADYEEYLRTLAEAARTANEHNPAAKHMPWQPEHPAGHSPFCVSPFHSTTSYCAASPDEPATMHGRPSAAWYRDHPDAARSASPAETGMRGDSRPPTGEPGPEYRVIYEFGGTEVAGIRAHATREEAEAEGRAADDPGLDGWYVEPPACASCGTEEGPDRQGRWEAGVPREKLGEWDACERCGAPLCDPCALAGASHDCQDTGDREGPS